MTDMKDGLEDILSQHYLEEIDTLQAVQKIRQFYREKIEGLSVSGDSREVIMMRITNIIKALDLEDR